MKVNAELGDNAVRLLYKLINDLLYFDDVEIEMRLCVSTRALKYEIFKLVYDEMRHSEYARTHEKLTRDIYIYNMSTKLHEYLRHCSHYQLHQTPRHSPYGSLQSIYTPLRPFYTIIIDFILTLSKTPSDYDNIISITKKTSKVITLIPGVSTWNGTQWVYHLLTRLLLLNWGLPQVIISDRDRKFVEQLWQQILKLLNVDLLYFTAWHPQTNEQFEKSNEIVEIALRYFILTVSHDLWSTVLSQLTTILNNSTKYSSTHLAPTEVLYGFKIKESLNLLGIEGLDLNDLIEATDLQQASNLTSQEASAPVVILASEQRAIAVQVPVVISSKPFTSVVSQSSTADVFSTRYSEATLNASYRPKHIDAHDALVFASVRMKKYYDVKHTSMFFRVGEHVHLRLHRGYQMTEVQSRKLGQQFAESFEVIERIERLAYRLKLSPTMKIHDVVSVVHLKPAIASTSDPYKRQPTVSSAVVVDNEDEHEIERLVRKRQRRYDRVK